MFTIPRELGEIIEEGKESARFIWLPPAPTDTRSSDQLIAEIDLASYICARHPEYSFTWSHAGLIVESKILTDSRYSNKIFEQLQ